MNRKLLHQACVAASVLTFGFFAMPASACTFELLGTAAAEGATLTWDPVPGALAYDVYVRTWYSGGYQTAGTTFQKTGRNSLSLDAVTTDDRQHEYLVLARSNDPAFACVGKTGIQLDGNRELAAMTNKRIIPLVGSARGANGSDFRTSLTMSKWSRRTGRIVFRPTGTVASDADPFIRYQFGDNDHGPEELYWEDIVASIGATGTGSLEIIPDRIGGETSLIVPPVVARLYNVAEEGTFGSRVSAVRPAEWFTDRATEQSSVGIQVPAAHGNVRRNIGFRSITEVTYRVSVFVPGQEVRTSFGAAPASYTYFNSLDAFVGEPVPANARVFVSMMSGYAIGFYTETDNVTNDPTLVIQSPFDLEPQVTWGYR